MVRIPTEYQEVEYIESTGTQYIDLPFGFDQTDEVKITGAMLHGFGDKYMVAPIRWNTDTNRFLMLGGLNSSFVFSFGSRGTPNSILTPAVTSDTKIHTMTYSNKIFTVVDTGSVADMTSESFGSTTANLRLFYGYASNTKGRIVYYHHKKADETEINLIPCYRKSDNKPGMYDTVSKTFYTNSGTGEFLVGNNVYYVYYDTTNLLESRRRILLTTPHLESPTPANPLIFKSDMTAKLKEGKVYFTPIQEGEGDPSPDNVRPILGWDGISVTKCGKNLLNPNDPDYANYTISPTGGPTTTSADRITTGFIPCGENVTLVASSTKKVTSVVFAFVVISAWDKNKQFISRAYVNSNSRLTFTTPEGTCYVRYSEQVTGNNNPTPSVFTKYERQLEFGTTPTAYEPYTETQITIPFPQTIYGGYVDLVNGEVVEEYTAVTLDGSVSPGIFPWQSKITEKDTGEILVKALYIKHNTKDNWHNQNCYLTAKCDKLLCTSNYNITNRGCSFYDGSSYSICLTLPESLVGTTTAELNQYLSDNPITTAFKLQTSIHHTIDPQVIRPLKGVNNIYSDANGNIEIKYWKH